MIEEELIRVFKKLKIKIDELDTRERPITLNLGTPTMLTIATGVITRTRSYHTVNTQGSASTDDLDTINGGVTGDILILRAYNNGRVVTVKDGTGNIQMAGDVTLDNVQDTLMLLFDGTNWLEIAASNNTAGGT